MQHINVTKTRTLSCILCRTYLPKSATFVYWRNTRIMMCAIYHWWQIHICVTNSYPCMCHELAQNTNDVMRNTSLSWHIYGYEFVTHIWNPYAYRLGASNSFSLPAPYPRPATMRVVEEGWGPWVYCALMRHRHTYRLKCTVMMCHELMSIYVSWTDPHQTWDFSCTHENHETHTHTQIRDTHTHTD